MKSLSLGLNGLSAVILIAAGVACSGTEGARGDATGGAQSTSTDGASTAGGGKSTGSGGTTVGSSAAVGAGGSSASGGAAGKVGSGSVVGAGGSNASGGTAGRAKSGGSDGGSAGSRTGGGTGGESGKSRDGGVSSAGSTNMGGSAGAGTQPTGGRAGNRDGGGSPNPAECSAEAGVITYPGLPGASESPLYTVTANGAKQFVEKMTKFSAEMQVHYAHFGVASGCKADISVTLKDSFSSFKLSPKSRNLSATKNGRTISFKSGPNYLILQVDTKELLFIFIDDEEVNPPKLGDANVKSIADYDVDAKGATIETSKIQSAINAASGAAQNILYFPPGRYKTGEIMLKSDMTLYLAAGAMLDGSTSTGDYKASGTPAVENTQHAVVHVFKAHNVNIMGRGVIDGNGTKIRGGSNDTPSFKIDNLRVDESQMIKIDGLVSRDSVFWNTHAFESDQVTVQNYKVINRRPNGTGYNETDGVDFDCSTNSKLYNGFIYSGDDSMSPKREQEGTTDTKNITYEKVVAYTNSAATKVGTKTYGKTMENLTFKDIDVVKAGRALGCNADDTAVIQRLTWQDIRAERVNEFETAITRIL